MTPEQIDAMPACPACGARMRKYGFETFMCPNCLHITLGHPSAPKMATTIPERVDKADAAGGAGEGVKS